MAAAIRAAYSARVLYAGLRRTVVVVLLLVVGMGMVMCEGSGGIRPDVGGSTGLMGGGLHLDYLPSLRRVPANRDREVGELERVFH